jgi:hypothetical protein
MWRDAVAAVVALLIALAVLVGAENEIIPSFHACVGQHSSQQGAESTYPQAINIVRTVKVQSLCSVYLVDRHAGFFATLATLSIASFTFTLWLATNKLWVASENTAKRQLRAYVFICDARRITAHIPALGVSIEIKNTGQTPAYDVTLYTGAVFDADPFTSIRPALKKEGFYLIGPGEFVTHRMTLEPVLTANELILIQSGKVKVFVYGFCDYRDAFNTMQRTDFCVEYTDNSVTDGALLISETGNSAT